MGFRKDGYATVWGVQPITDTFCKVRLSTSRKNKTTGEYETDFNGYVGFFGSLAAHKAVSLKEKDRIKLGNVEVTTTYDKEKRIQYTNYKCYDFEMASNPRPIENKVEDAAEPEPQESFAAVDEDCPF